MLVILLIRNSFNSFLKAGFVVRFLVFIIKFHHWEGQKHSMFVTDIYGDAVWGACFMRVQGGGRLDFSRVMIIKG